MPARQVKPAISEHPTLKGKILVNWKQTYKGEFHCVKCGNSQFFFELKPTALCKLCLKCKRCNKTIYLSCSNRQYIFRYQASLCCPNPSCQLSRTNEQKREWIFLRRSNPVNGNRYECRWCGVSFVDKSKTPQGRTYQDILVPFQFEADQWDLRNFYNYTQYKMLHFEALQPEWYKLAVKQYLKQLLQANRYAAGSIHLITVLLRKFGKAVAQSNLKQISDIGSLEVSTFLDTQIGLSTATYNRDLTFLRDFLDWLDVKGPMGRSLLPRSLSKKIQIHEPEWIDEPTRQAIQHHLDKIPLPIARQYRVALYTAARVIDVGRMSVDCLKQDGKQWFIHFFQQKVQRWHRLPASRDIRSTIEAQQQWICQTLGTDYPYLFCHFRGLRKASYPAFPGMRPIATPPGISVKSNQMIRIIRLLIENENITDSNGKIPFFTGELMRPTRLQEVRSKYGLEAAQLYADHQSIATTLQHYAPPTREEVATIDLPFQQLLLNADNRFLPWQSLPGSLLKQPQLHELDIEIAPRLVVYGYCALDPKTPCPFNLYPKCYGCSSFRPSTSKLPFYQKQYMEERKRLNAAKTAGAELAYEEAKTTIEAMDQWLDELRRIADD